jgi:hypothetical protein
MRAPSNNRRQRRHWRVHERCLCTASDCRPFHGFRYSCRKRSVVFCRQTQRSRVVRPVRAVGRSSSRRHPFHSARLGPVPPACTQGTPAVRLLDDPSSSRSEKGDPVTPSTGRLCLPCRLLARLVWPQPCAALTCQSRLHPAPAAPRRARAVLRAAAVRIRRMLRTETDESAATTAITDAFASQHHVEFSGTRSTIALRKSEMPGDLRTEHVERRRGEAWVTKSLAKSLLMKVRRRVVRYYPLAAPVRIRH